MSKIDMTSESPLDRERYDAIVKAIKQLQSAFRAAELREPIAILLDGSEQGFNLADLMNRVAFFGHVGPLIRDRPWEGMTICGTSVINKGMPLIPPLARPGST